MPRAAVPFYEAHRDVLYVSIDGVRGTESEPVAVDLFLLHDQESSEVVGLECLDFSRHGGDASWLDSVPESPRVFLLPTNPRHAVPLADVLRFLYRDASERRAFRLEGDESELTAIGVC